MDGISKELAKEYSDIFKSDAEGTGYKQSVDKAYEQPDYGATGEEAVDPRDPSTFTDDDNEAADDVDNEDIVDDEGPDNETESEEPDYENDDEYEEIPDRLVSAGRRRGYSDDKIMKLAEDAPEVLEDLADLQEMVSDVGTEMPPPPTDQEKKEAPEKPEDVEKIHIETELIEAGDDVKNVIKKLQDGYNSMVDQVNNLQGKQTEHDKSLNSFTQQQTEDYVRRVDSFFDQAAKDFPELGDSKELSVENMEFRQKVHDDAFALTQNGRPFGEALEFVLNAHKGQKSEQEVKKSVAKDLNRRKKSFTARPSHRKTAAKTTSPKDDALDAIEQFQRENGWV